MLNVMSVVHLLSGTCLSEPEPERGGYYDSVRADITDVREMICHGKL